MLNIITDCSWQLCFKCVNNHIALSSLKKASIDILSWTGKISDYVFTIILCVALLLPKRMKTSFLLPGCSAVLTFLIKICLSQWPVCLTGHFWSLGTFGTLRFILWCCYSLVAPDTTDCGCLMPLLPGTRLAQFCPATQLSCILNLSLTFLFAELYCMCQA